MSKCLINNIVTISSGFAAEAANDAAPSIHILLLARMDEQQENIGSGFRDNMAEILTDMNLDSALTKQSGMLNGVPLGTDMPIVTHCDINVWMNIEMDMWNAVIDSYIEDLSQNDHEKFLLIYQNVGQAACDHYHRTKTHLDIQATRLAFEDFYKDEMKALNMVADILGHYFPEVGITTAIAHCENAYVAAIVRMSAPDGHDLRALVSGFIKKRPAIKDVTPQPI